MDKIQLRDELFSLADQDMAVAEHTAAHMHPLPLEVICFHCQQCAEKYLKGYLAYNNVAFEKIHNLTMLLTLCDSVNESLKSILSDKCAFLNNYGVVPRYSYEQQIDESDMRTAIEYAKFIKSSIRQLLGLSDG